MSVQGVRKASIASLLASTPSIVTPKTKTDKVRSKAEKYKAAAAIHGDKVVAKTDKVKDNYQDKFGSDGEKASSGESSSDVSASASSDGGMFASPPPKFVDSKIVICGKHCFILFETSVLAKYFIFNKFNISINSTYHLICVKAKGNLLIASESMCLFSYESDDIRQRTIIVHMICNCHYYHNIKLFNAPRLVTVRQLNEICMFIKQVNVEQNSPRRVLRT